MRRSLFTAIILVGLSGTGAFTQAPVSPGHDLPNPYQPGVRNWGVLPDNRTWGSTAGVEIGPHNEIWAIDRCGVNTCDGSNLPPVHLMDLATGRPTKSIGEGLFVFPHGLHVDRDGNIWVTDALASKDGTKGHQVIKLSPDGKVLMRLGTAGVAGGGPTHFNEPSDVVTAPNGDIFVADGHSGQNPKVPPDYVTRIVRFSKRRQVHQGVGEARARAPGSSEMRTRWRSTRAAACSSATAETRACRSSTRTASSSPSGSSSGVRAACTSTRTTSCTSSTPIRAPATNPGWKKGIRIGSAKDGKVVAFVPGHQTDNPDGAAGEGIVSDPAGNLYAAENTLRGVTKYAKQ